MISFSGWQSVDINFFKMFRSCLFKRFLIKTGNKKKTAFMGARISSDYLESLLLPVERRKRLEQQSDEFQATFMASV